VCEYQRTKLIGNGLPKCVYGLTTEYAKANTVFLYSHGVTMGNSRVERRAYAGAN